MMKTEFENIAGYRVTNYTYNHFIEPMYNATTLDKETFIKYINRQTVEFIPVRDIRDFEDKRDRIVDAIAGLVYEKDKRIVDYLVRERDRVEEIIKTLKLEAGWNEI